MGIIEKIAVDDETMKSLAADAERHGRTVAEEAAETLRIVARRMNRDEFLRRANEIAAMTPVGVVQTDSVDLIREDRDR